MVWESVHLHTGCSESQHPSSTRMLTARCPGGAGQGWALQASSRPLSSRSPSLPFPTPSHSFLTPELLLGMQMEAGNPVPRTA